MITIVDYGLGNIRAFLNVFSRLNIEAKAAKCADDLARATKLILPGVGHFDRAMAGLTNLGMSATLRELVMSRRVPILGVCVGMQILGGHSEEGDLPGLGWINGRVRRFESSDKSRLIPVPHMGWNDVRSVSGDPLFEGLNGNSRFYFLHSYIFQCENATEVVAVSEYWGEFACAIRSGHIWGVQFHPEKSHRSGIQVLKNFALRC